MGGFSRDTEQHHTMAYNLKVHIDCWEQTSFQLYYKKIAWLHEE